MKNWLYCKCCKRNYTESEKHKLQSKHKDNLKLFLEKQQKKVNDLKFLMKNRSIKINCKLENKFWCSFCDKELIDPPETPLKLKLNHLASLDHLLAVKQFFKSHGKIDELKNYFFYTVDPNAIPIYFASIRNNKEKEEENKIDCSLNKAKFLQNSEGKQYLESIKSNESFLQYIKDKEKKQIEVMQKRDSESNPITLGFTTFSPKEILLPEMKQQVTQTVNGTDQNLMGRNEKGQRVWGGGIKEVSASEWIPWPIDMIILNYYKQKTSEYRRLEDVKKQTEKKLEEAREENDKTILVTNNAKGYGLSTIRRLGSTKIEGNIHNDALPPWLSDEKQTKTSLNAFRSWEDIRKAIREKNKEKREKRFSKKHKSEEVLGSGGKNWLPNFGSVWEAGARSNTRRGFLEEISKYEHIPTDAKKYSEEETNKSFGDKVRSGEIGLSTTKAENELRKQKEILRRKLMSR